MTNPLDGPFMTSKQLTDYSDQPGYAIPPAQRGHVDPPPERAVRPIGRFTTKLDGQLVVVGVDHDAMTITFLLDLCSVAELTRS